MIGKLLSGAAAKVLAALDSPATDSDIVLGKEAYNSNGDKITGTLESINNPWKPSSQSEYDTIVASKNKVGNYIEYSGKTTKVMPEVFSGVFNIGDTVTDVWFDTSITPSTPFFTEWDVTGISYNSKYYRVKYLMVGDGTWTFGDTTLKQGIMIIASESDGYAWSIYYGYPYGEDMLIYSNSASDFLIKGWIFDYNTELETKVTFDSGLVLTTLLSSGYSWNGYFAFKNKTEQYGKQYYPLPTLANEGTASDLAEGKELINSNGEKIVGTAASGGEKYFDIEGVITTTTTSLVLTQIPPNVKDIHIILEYRYNNSSGGVDKLTQIGLNMTPSTGNLGTSVSFVCYRQASSNIVSATATYDADTQTLTLTNNYIQKSQPYRYFVKLL